jgi:hypothetical protein
VPITGTVVGIVWRSSRRPEQRRVKAAVPVGSLLAPLIAPVLLRRRVRDIA